MTAHYRVRYLAIPLLLASIAGCTDATSSPGSATKEAKSTEAASSKIADKKAVSITYKLTDPDGKVIDQSESGKPLDYIHGTGALITGLESALAGKEVGDKFQVTLEPKDAYGERDEALIHTVKREELADVKDLSAGMQLQMQSGGQIRIVTVKEIKDDEVVIDANHELAGTTLTFDVGVVAVRDATAEELAHGHVHGPGEDHH